MKKVVVIGGGPAGMMAASTAADNGSEVILLEKQHRLGRKLFIGKEILKEIKARLKFLVDVGLDYITMSRSFRLCSRVRYFGRDFFV